MNRIVVGTWLVLLTGFSAVAGCSCGDPQTFCQSADECPTGFACVANACVIGDGGGMCLVDRDQDGYGEGCPAGPDCDDSDPEKGHPDVEYCDGVDNNCNGEVDEVVKDLCKTCVPACGITPIPADGNWKLTDDNSDNVIIDPSDGSLTLDKNRTERIYLWIANDGEGTVSKLDSVTGKEVARYTAARNNFGLSAGELRPSRTAVDQRFDAYVANRAHQGNGGQGSITKYANKLNDCVDSNGIEGIQTSSDLNDDGVIDTDPAAGEYLGDEDDCLLWTRKVGEARDVPRALAVGVSAADEEVGLVWAGLNGKDYGSDKGRKACALDANSGDQLFCVDTPNFKNYGAAADEKGRMWFVDRGGRGDGRILGYVDPATREWKLVKENPLGNAASPYGMTVDDEENVYLVTSAGGGSPPRLWRYSTTNDQWTGVDIPGGGNPRGVAVDDQYVWVANSHSQPNTWDDSNDQNLVQQFARSNLAHIRDRRTGGVYAPTGVGVSFDGSIWAIGRNTDNAARLDPDDFDDDIWTTHPVGEAPYTYSDFLGFGLNRNAQPRGEHRVIIQGCEGGTNLWQGATYDADVPNGTHVALWARVADTIEGLDDNDWIGPFVGEGSSFTVDLTEDPGPLGTSAFLQIEIRLRSDEVGVVPRIFDLSVAGVCVPNPI